MGDRDRNRSYYDRNYEHRQDDRDEWRSGREQRGWDAQRDYQTQQRRNEAEGYPGPYGWYQDPSVNRDFGNRDMDHDTRSSYRGSERGERSQYGDRTYPSYGDRSQYGERNYSSSAGQRMYPSYGDRVQYGRDRQYGDWNRSGSSDRDAWQRGQSQSWGRNYGAEEPYYREERDREHQSFGGQLREAGQRIARSVKRAFRGPKGYKRSDDRIREDVNDRLADQSDFDPSEIEVAVANGEVTLTGSVRTRSEKFLAEEIADDVSGVNEVHNQLRVKREQTAPFESSTATQQGASNQAWSESSRNRNSRAT